MNILEMMDDPALMGRFFKGSSWRPWRSFLATLFALPMDARALAIYRQHTGRQAAPTLPFSEAAMVCGRRAGKSRILGLLATYLACFRDYTPFLALGEKATIVVICADRRQARIVLRYIAAAFETVPLLTGMVAEQTAESLTLTNSVVIEVATASFRVTRGYSLAAAICDETSFWKTEESTSPDVEIYRALRPSMATIPGSLLVSASSPYRKRGVLWDTYRRWFGIEGGKVLVWQADTASMNPSVDPEFIAQAYLDDPAAAASELGAQFRDDISDFLTMAQIEDCVIPGRAMLPRSGGHTAFADLAGGGADSHCLCVAHRGPDGVAVVDRTVELRGPSSPEDAVVRFAVVLKEYGLSSVTGDKFASTWPIVRFQEQGIRYHQSERSKAEIYTNFLPILLSRRVELTDDPRLVGQFAALERRTQRGGRDSVDHPPGGHDDLANSVAGACLAASNKPNAGALWAALAP